MARPSQLLSPEGVWKQIHGRAAAGGEQHRACLHEDELPLAHVDEQDPGD